MFTMRPRMKRVRHGVTDARVVGKYRPWAELTRFAIPDGGQKRTFSFDVLRCPSCNGRMKLRAMVTDPISAKRYVKSIDEAAEPPAQRASRSSKEGAPPRGPPYWRSTVLRRLELGDVA